MSRRLCLCVSAVSAVLFLSGSIVVSSRSLDALEVGNIRVAGQWKASSPTVQTRAGEYLAYSVEGAVPRVYFTRETGAHTTWAFVDMKKYTEHGLEDDPKRRRSLSVDETGFTLRLRATAGPFRGWYLSQSRKGDLVLVKEPDLSTAVRFRLKVTKSTYR